MRFGPRLGATYKLDEKTVVRGGWGITYSAVSNWWYVTGRFVDARRRLQLR